MFRLALTMGRTVAELAASLSPAEWAGWVAFHDAEPFGPRQEDRRAAYQLAAWAGSGFRAEDCFPSLASPAPASGPSGFRAWASARCPAMVARNGQVDHRATGVRPNFDKVDQ